MSRNGLERDSSTLDPIMHAPLDPQTIKRKLRIWAWHAETRFDRYRRHVTRRIRPLQDILVQPYLGFGNEEYVELSGRVMQDRHIPDPSADSSRWENSIATVKRIASREIGGARLRARYCGEEREVVSDREGYFRFRFDCGRQNQALWEPVSITLLEPLGNATEPFTVQAEALRPPDRCEYGVISDIDDTVVESNATSFLKLMKLTLMRNAYTRVPFEGVAALYRGFRDGVGGEADNPVFYVSSSAWNVYDLLLRFMQVHGLPKGPLFLRDIGIEREYFFKSPHRVHKRATIDRILQTYPNLPFILVGDSGQKDAEIYQSVARDYPGRILAIYIRRVGHFFTEHMERIAEEVNAEGGDMQLVPDSETAARHAIARGFIRADYLDQVHQQKERDEDEARAADNP